MEILNEYTFDTKFNQTRHEFEIYFDNSAGESDERRYGVNPNSIVNLTIEDTLADWVLQGHMTFYYNPEASVGTYDDRTGNKADAKTSLLTPQQKGFYVFRNDGNDLLRIRIKPNLQDSSNLAKVNATKDLNITDEKHWTLSYLFSIYDVEDIDLPPGARNQASSTVKCLKVYFWDAWYQKMITNYLSYSTALSYTANIERDRQERKYANPGVIPTGQAMKEIIDLSLCQKPSQDNYKGNVSGLTDTSIRLTYNPTPDIGEEWDEGAAKVFFTAPTQYNAYESLMHVYDKHISTESYSTQNGTPTETGLHDFSILVKERGPEPTDVGQICLKSMSSFFNKAGNAVDTPGPYQVEHYFLQSYGAGDSSKISDKDVAGYTTQATRSYRAPISDTDSDTVDLKLLKYNQITNYRFVDIAALTNTKKFCTTPVHSFDFKNRTFNIEYQNNKILTAREFMSQKYISQVYKTNTDDNEKLFLITLDKDKLNKNITPTFSCNGDDPLIRQSDGLKKLLYVGIFQNACINFRTLGLTNRDTGRFIAIDKTEGVDTGAFEDKFYGQWFVINVKHIFETEIYYNDITAIKIHRFDTLPLNFVGTIDNQ